MTYGSLLPPSPSFLQAVRERLGPGGVVDPADGARYFEEPRGKFRGTAAVIARPADVDAVSAVIRLCADARVGVVPWGGGTGLVGGQTLPNGPPPLLLSLERMRRIRATSVDDDSMIVEAGATLADAQQAAAEINRLFPLSLASEGSCRIGGNLATNAGGVTVLRYGNARDLCLGIEAVTPGGGVIHGLKTLRKNNTGYDLRHLLIGSEGTLGVITAAALKLFPQPAETVAAFAAAASVDDAVTLLRRVQAALGESVTAFELMSAQGLAFLGEAGIEGVRAPLTTNAPWCVLIDVGGGAVREPFEAALSAALESDLITDAVMTDSDARRAQLWRVREEIPTANRAIGAVASHDVSTPVDQVAAFIAAADAALAKLDPTLRVNCFGHLGDGNMHYNLFPPPGRSRRDYADVAPTATRIVHDLAVAHGGSFSAEHGVGRFKTDELIRYGDPTALAAMVSIKRALDPHGIMNPGAVLPLDLLRAAAAPAPGGEGPTP